MGTKYPGNTSSGYNASPPPDDGSTGADNLVTWEKHRTKLTDPLRTYIDAINTDLNTWADNTPTAKATNYSTDADDNGRVIECTSTPTITLGAAATMGAGYEVTVKCVSGTTTVATGETIDGSPSNRTITAGNSETYVVNNAGSAYMIKQFTPPITLTNTVTMSNKTLTSPVINTGVSGTAIDTDTALAADSDTLLASQKATKAYSDARAMTHLAAFTTTGAATLGETTSIPASASKIEILFNGVSLSGTDKIQIEIGDASGYAASSGGARGQNDGASASATGWSGSGPAEVCILVGAGETITGIVTLVKQTGSSHVWIVSGVVVDHSSNRTTYTAGYIDNTVEITKLKVTASAGTFDAGRAEVKTYVYDA